MQVNFDGSRPTQTEGEAMVLELQRGGHEVDRKLDEGRVQLFKGSKPLDGDSSGYNTVTDEEERDIDVDRGKILG